MDVPERHLGKDRSCTGLSFGMISSFSLMVSWQGNPCGAPSAFGISRACSSSSGMLHPLATSFTILLYSKGALTHFADLWFPRWRNRPSFYVTGYDDPFRDEFSSQASLGGTGKVAQGLLLI